MIKELEISDEILFKYQAQIKKYQKEEFLARYGSKPKSIIYIYSGNVKIVTLTEGGDEFLHGFNEAHSLIGIGTYMGGYVYYNDFIAVGEVETREIPLDQFELLMRDDFRITRKIIKYLADIIEGKTQTLSAVLGKSPREKILFFMDRTKEHMLKNEKGIIPFTRQEMANFLGMRVETIIRSIKELEEEGLLEIEKGKIIY